MAEYETYQATPYCWLPKVPAHWTRRSIRQITSVLSERCGDKNLRLLSVYREYGVIPKDSRDDNHNKESLNLSNYKVVHVGNLVLNKMKMWQGSLGISRYEGIVSPAYIICKVLDHGINLDYLHLLLRSARFKSYYNQYSYGIRVGQWDMHYEDFKNLQIYLPPRAEQDQIVRFLDWKVSKINKLISIRRKEIQGLEELKACTIDQIVIHGLCGSSEIHNDDSLWNINYPSLWKLERFRDLFTFRKGLSITKADLKPSGIPVINYGQVHSKKNSMVGLNDELYKFVIPSYQQTAPSALVERGDFIFADTSEDLDGSGNCVYVDRDKRIFAGYHTVIAHPKGSTNNKYFAYLFKSSTWRYQIRKKVNTVKVYSITQQILKDVFLLIPPEKEQWEIVKYLDNACSKIDSLIESTYKKIIELIDMKSAIISDVVTGKVDVRGIPVPAYEHVDDIADDDAVEDDAAGEEAELV